MGPSARVMLTETRPDSQPNIVEQARIGGVAGREAGRFVYCESRFRWRHESPTLAHNANLSIKAIDALGAFAEMAEGVGDDKLAREYKALSKEMAKKWIDLAKEGDHYKLAFDSTNTWSQKYNLVWDDLLALKLFPASVKNTELAYYKTKLNQYGLPLDSRKDYTKLDWELWTATLADDDATFRTLVAPLGKWLDETPTRVPLTDWYDTKTAKQQGFQARSVVGGLCASFRYPLSY